LAIIDRRELGERAASHALQALAKRERPALAVEQRARCLDVRLLQQRLETRSRAASRNTAERSALSTADIYRDRSERSTGEGQASRRSAHDP
jgi:hypothetical protein